MLPRKQIQREGIIKQFSAKDIPTEPLPLPEGFEWSTYDARDDKVAAEVCDFLMDHYVEGDGDFRLVYTVEKFKWATLPPGYVADFQFCVRS